MSRLTIVIGPMFSGKSTYLIKQINNFKDKNSLLSINHSIDNRYDYNKIVNHNKINVDCLSLTNIKDISKFNIDLHKFQHLFIDEAQFFNDLEESVKFFLVTYPKLNITCVGLDGDYQQNVFNKGQLLNLIPHSDNLIKLYSKCYQCGKKAGFTKRINDFENLEKNSQILVGSSDMYQPACYIHK
jgi:thymidine kinase